MTENEFEKQAISTFKDIPEFHQTLF